DGLARQIEAQGERRRRAVRKALEHARIVGRVHHHENVAEVLGGGAHHAGPADVDLLNQRVEPRGRVSCRFRERVEVYDDQVDEADAVPGQGGQVVRPVAPGQDAAVDARVQGLHAAVEHLGKPGALGHVGDGQPRLPEGTGGAAGGEQLDAEGRQAAGEVDDAGLVGNGDEC